MWCDYSMCIWFGASQTEVERWLVQRTDKYCFLFWNGKCTGTMKRLSMSMCPLCQHSNLSNFATKIAHKEVLSKAVMFEVDDLDLLGVRSNKPPTSSNISPIIFPFARRWILRYTACGCSVPMGMVGLQNKVWYLPQTYKTILTWGCRTDMNW